MKTFAICRYNTTHLTAWNGEAFNLIHHAVLMSKEVAKVTCKQMKNESKLIRCFIVDMASL